MIKLEDLMTQNLKLNEYKQGIADLYDQRSESYDENDRLAQICRVSARKILSKCAEMKNDIYTKSYYH